MGDALWLAALRGAGPRTEPPPDQPPPPPDPAPGPADTPPDPPGAPDDPPAPDRPPEPPGPDTRPGVPPDHLPPAAAAPPAALVPPLPVPGPADSAALPGAPRLSERRALVRAFQLFRRTRDSARAVRFDEDATAHGFAQRALADPRPGRARRTPVLPEFAPLPEPADDLTVLIDDSVSMIVQQPLVADLLELLAPLRVFRAVRAFTFDSDKARADDLALRADRGPAPAADRLVGGGRDLLLVLSDGVGDGWHNGAMGAWLARWGADAAVGVGHLLDRTLWRGTGMRPRNVSLEVPPAGGGGLPANARYRVRPTVSEGPAPALPAGGVAVPLFPLEPHDIERWALFLTGRRGGRGYATTALVADPDPDPAAEDDDEDGATALFGAAAGPVPRPLDARARVELFRVVASPEAFRLAVRLAAVPLNLATIRLVQERFAPHTRPSDLTEVLCSGLVRRTAGSPAVDRDDRVTLEFHPGVRELLLAAGGSRREVKELLEAVAARYRESLPWFAALERLLLGRAAGDRLPGAAPAEAPFVRAVGPALGALPAQFRRAAGGPPASAGPGDGPPRADPPPAPAPRAADPSTADRIAAPDRESPEDTTVVPADPQLTGTPQATSPGGTASPALNGGGPPDPLRYDPYGPVPQGPRTRPMVWGAVPPRNATFVGRESLLTQLAERLREGDTTVLPHAAPERRQAAAAPVRPPVFPQTLQGMGGVGKTQLALEFAWRHRGDYDLVWWIPSDTPSQIQQSLIELAPKLGVGPGGDPAAMVRAVLEALRAGTPYANWLLVYDSAGEPSEVRPLIPVGGPGQVLVTSRYPQWRSVSGNLVQVDTFERHESTELLHRRGPEGLAAADADRIAEKLGDLPLAIEQTAVWLYETLMPAAEWLELFDEKTEELLSHVAPSPDYPWSVAATMNMTLERLRESNPGALRLLQVCAFLAPQPIPRRLFNNARNVEAPAELAAILADPGIELSRALRAIDRYALAKMDHRNSTFQLHRLVQEALKLPLSEDERSELRHCAHLLLANLDPGDPLSAHDWPRYVELLPHVWETEQWDCQSEWARQLVLSEVRFLDLWGRSAEAEPLARRALDLWTEKLGAEHPQTLRASMRYALVLSSLGRFQESYDRSIRLVDTLTRLRGVDDEETLEARIDMALDLRNLGRFSDAVEVSREVFERQQRLFGRDDPLTLQTAHIHAIGLRLTGDFTAAMEIDRHNHERRIQMLGPEHVRTLSSKYGYALGLMESGRYWESMQALDEVHADNTRLYPAQSSLRLITMLALSTVKRRTGRLREAVALSEEAYRLFAEHAGPDAQNTVRAAASHAVSLRAAGEHDAALALSTDARERYRSIFGARHPLYADTSLNHAVTLRLLGRVDEARAVDEEAMAVHVERLGEDHPATLANAVNLASDLFAAGDARSALAMDERTHERAVRVFGDDHPLTLAAQRNTVLDRRVVEGVELEAERADVVRRYRAMFGADHPATRSADHDVRANCDLFMNGM
ncbi:FxSxx-COOH system tetratricopeptide repeat protein [Nocardiopsis trehalosi]|uniref:FxSxx-COOH system tetratricopeptide repeat protein n=1 Tax=Nocardiopsis trehalosi TaxID=109329 RepID=UPI000AB98AD3|nr:FxSxx-COOH system tetratricopeptide repeat protein [Nocardiopsis trehalosi]